MEAHTLSSFIHQKVLNWIEKTPDAIAVSSKECSYTYRELGERWALLQQTFEDHPPQSRIAVLVTNLALAYPAYLAAMGQNYCFIPLNPEFPDQRLADILEDCQPAGIVVEEQLKGRLDNLLSKSLPEANPQIIQVQTKHTQTTIPKVQNTSEDSLAYIMFTSGTTGRPKGVMINHRNLQSFVEWASQTYHISPKDRLSQHSRVSFDLSIFDIFGALSNGASLYPIESKMDLAFPGNFLSANQISICLAVPSVIGTMERAGQLENLDFSKHLRHFLVCGEALSPSLAQAWLKHQPDVPLHNLYGPTEATVACTHQRVTGDELQSSRASISIGTPTLDTDIFILDPESGNLVADGNVGALYLAGDQLGPGYWKNPEQTSKVFLEFKEEPKTRYNTGDLALRDPNGKLFWMGRQDQQVNINGYRVELPEIEGYIARCTTLDPFAVIASGEPLEIKLVITSHDLQDDPKEQLNSLNDMLKEYLPSYMFPASIQSLKELPRNSNGKIDRKAIANLI